MTPSSGDAVWNKFMRTSNWIDMVLHEFDQTYQWGQDQRLVAMGEPLRRTPSSNTAPSLRSMYAHWIDDHLTKAEEKASDWSTAANKNYKKDYEKDKKQTDYKKWMKAAFDSPDGFAHPDNLKFPRMTPSTQGVSKFGVWGNERMAFDAKGKKVTPYIGAPPAI